VNDNTGAPKAGAACLFDTSGALLQTFLNPTPEDNDRFGESVSISGNNVLVGTFFDNTGATQAGAAYLFNATSGNLLHTLLSPAPETFDQYARAVSISGNNVLVGSENDNISASGAGAAYLYNATTGNLTQTFLNPTPELGDFFGTSVSISGNNVLVGAKFDNTGANEAGAAYLFDATTGNLTQTFLNPTPEFQDLFGLSVSISGNNVLVGADLDNTGATDTGAAYLFDATTGNLTQTFLNPTPEANDIFGEHVSISGNNVLVSARNDNTRGTTAGAAYLFDATSGALLHTFLPPPPTRQFGSSVSISGNNVLVGVATDNTGNTDSGVAFLFDATNLSNSTVVSIPNTAINNMTTPLSVISGNYSVTETVPAGWTLDASDCEKNGISLGTTLNFNVTLGDSVECIFENTKLPVPPSLPTIKITKNATNADGAFDFTITNSTGSTTVVLYFQIYILQNLLV